MEMQRATRSKKRRQRRKKKQNSAKKVTKVDVVSDSHEQQQNQQQHTDALPHHRAQEDGFTLVSSKKAKKKKSRKKKSGHNLNSICDVYRKKIKDFVECQDDLQQSLVLKEMFSHEEKKVIQAVARSWGLQVNNSGSDKAAALRLIKPPGWKNTPKEGLLSIGTLPVALRKRFV